MANKVCERYKAGLNRYFRFMNFLAHLYLSGEHEQLQFGNFIGDFVKGKPEHQLPGKIAKGVHLHRFIDAFTDHHQTVRNAKRGMYVHFGKYSGVVLDIYFDFFLANQWAQFHTLELPQFTRAFYRVLDAHAQYIPQRAERFLQYMVERDLLSGYAQINTLNGVFNGLNQRSSFETGMEKATTLLMKEHELFKRQFEQFFPELIVAAAKERERLNERV